MNETQIIMAYEPMIQRCVNHFMSRAGMGSTSRKEDLLQEARISFLTHIRSHAPDEYGKCHYTILHDLCEAARRDYPLSISRQTFLNKKKEPLFLLSLDDIAVLEDGEESLAACELRCSIEAVLKNHPETDTLLIQMKAEGSSNRQAGKRLGMSDSQVSKKLKQIRRELTAQ